ncbi:MAG: iron chelate uptake ABC transporter family permease subunit [Bacteroidota bacterium]
MESLIELFQHAYAIRALLASAMVGIMCGVLGCFIVLKNMSLIGDALSHAILPGVVAGFLIAGYSIMGFFTGSVVAGLLAAVLITWIQRNVKTQEDAAIGIVFTSMFAIGVMGISWLTRQEGVHLDLKDFLFGNVLGISNQDLWMTFLVLGFTLVCISAFYRYFFITTFESVIAQTIGISTGTMHYFLMLLLSFAVVASLQSVGVILVVAMLITPASTAYLLTYKLKKMVLIAGLTGLLSTTLGLLMAIIFETTPGPAMTVTATALYLLAVFFSPKRGLMSRYVKKRKKQTKILREDILKQAVRQQEHEKIDLERIGEKLGISTTRVKRVAQKMLRSGEFVREHGQLTLTPHGTEQGYALVRAHRLWETYLVQKMGLSLDQIHEDAEKYEHILTEELVEEVALSLGNPQEDPHGSPIPQKHSTNIPSLASISENETVTISQKQRNHLIRSQLWDAGLIPGLAITVLDKEGGKIKIRLQGSETELPLTLAEQIRVDS